MERQPCLWNLDFSPAPESRLRFQIYAYTAAQARRKLKAAITQALEGKASMRVDLPQELEIGTVEMLLAGEYFYGPDFEGTGMTHYSSIHEMVENAFLTRQPWRDVALIERS